MKKPIIGITTDIDGEFIQLDHQYCDAVADAGGVPLLMPVTQNPSIYREKIDGLLIPGGDDLDPSYYREDMLPMVKLVPKTRSDFEMFLLKKIVELSKPVLGICYGMQLLNVFFRGTLYQDIDAQASVAINHKKDYHTIVITENRFLQKGTFSVNSTHHQAIKALGAGLKAFAHSKDNIVEAFFSEQHAFLVGVQWHPERMMHHELSVQLFRYFIKASRDHQ